MNYETILNNLDGIFILVIDQDNNIIYPKIEKIKDKCINIYKNYLKDEDCCYHDSKYYLIGRYGGEEFIILIENSDKNHSIKIMEEIRQKIADISIKHHNSTINNITISCGIHNVDYIYNKSNIEKIRDEFINYADIALYKSKKNGKNQITVY